MDAAGVRPDQIDVFIPHQANARINEVLAKNLDLRPDAIVANDIEHTGNTSAASIPLAMAELLSTGAAKPGDLALLIGYGAGLSYAAQVVRMPTVELASSRRRFPSSGYRLAAQSGLQLFAFARDGVRRRRRARRWPAAAAGRTARCPAASR